MARMALTGLCFVLLGTLAFPGWAQSSTPPRDGETEISLSEALREAGTNNPGIRAAQERVRQSEYGVRQQRSALLPTVSARVEYSHHEEPSLIEPMREPPGPASGELPFDDRIYSAAVRLSVPIVNLPPVAAVAGARSDVGFRHAQTSEAQQTVLARVTEVYVQSAQIDDNVMLFQAHIAALERRLADLRVLHAEGRVTVANVAEVELSLDVANSDMLELEQRRHALAARLGSLLGRREPVAPARTELIAPAFNNQSAESSPAGPQLQQAEAQLGGAQAVRHATQYSFVPTVDGFVSQSARSGSDLDFFTEWSAGVSLTIPLFTGGERVARLKAADAGLAAAQQAVASARLAEDVELRSAIRRWESSAQRRDLMLRAAEHQQRVVRAEQERYHEGRSALADVLSQEATLLQFRMQERSLLYEQLLAFVVYQQTAGNLSAELIEQLDAATVGQSIGAR